MTDSRSRLRTVPVTLREANAFVKLHHRHHKEARGHRLSTGVIDELDALRGVAIMSRPVARNTDYRAVLEVVRLATDGCPNACSCLYGACCRIADAAGYEKASTFILGTEPGTSLIAAGWKPVALSGGGSWSREGREREDDHPLIPKVRYECRHSSLPALDLEYLADLWEAS